MSKQFVDSAGIPIRYLHQVAHKSRGRVIVLPGMGEYIEKYEPICTRFLELGFDTLCLDWPSQGLSGRLVPNRPHLVHADSYDQHLDALIAACKAANFLEYNANNKTQKNTEPNLFVFGHSMGAHLALRGAERIKEHVEVAGIMLIAPMMMPTGIYPPLVKVFLECTHALGLSTKPLLIKQNFAKNWDVSSNNRLTRSARNREIEAGLILENPALWSYGPSFGWARAAFKSCSATTANREWMEKLNIPVQVHLAEDERIVPVSYFSYLNCLSQVETYDYADARHELMQELPETLELVWERMEAFIDNWIKFPTSDE